MGSLGRYEILRHLATGGMAEVLLARASGIEGFERHVVIKRIRPDQVRDQSFVQMFLDEARLAAALHHHNIVQVHDIGQENNEYFFAMDYVHGEDARSLLMRVAHRKELVPLEHVITIITAAAAGLHHAHEQVGPDRKPLGIVHRDVSPANILIGYDGGVKVADFGIAKAALRSVQTQSGSLKGKVAYMSPEQCTGKLVDRRSDVFALGVVLYELVAARRLFKGESDFLTMSAIVQGEIPPPSNYRADLPPELEEIVMKALAGEPERRYQTADELRLVLQSFASSHGLSTSSTALADYMKRQFGTRPEPWLVDAEIPAELPVDFDGTASGIVRSPVTRGDLRAASEPSLGDAPIANARKRVSPRAPAPVEARAATATGSGTPMAWSPEVGLSSRRRIWLVMAIGAGAAALVIAIVTLAGGHGDGERRPAKEPAAAPTVTPTVTDRDSIPAATPIQASAPAADPGPTSPPVAAAVAPVGDGSATPGPRPAAPPKKPLAPKKPKPDPEWDRDVLFLK